MNITFYGILERLSNRIDQLENKYVFCEIQVFEI